MNVSVVTDGPVAIVTIDRPEVRNAVDGPTAVALPDAFAGFDADPSLAVAVLTAAGGTFCSGAELKALATGEHRAVPVPVEVHHGLATIESGETLTGAQRFAAGAGRHGSA